MSVKAMFRQFSLIRTTKQSSLVSMRTITLLVLIVTTACNKKSADQSSGFTANVRVVSPFAGTMDGKLYLSKRHLRVDLGSMSDVYDANQEKGWRILRDSKQYMNIGWKDVSTYMPPMTNGSPCSRSEQPATCKMVGKETINDRPATKWELLNHHGERVYLWTDDEAEIAVRWQIENVTYEATDVGAAAVPDGLFVLPSGYTLRSR
jgi:hypothetical protein